MIKSFRVCAAGIALLSASGVQADSTTPINRNVLRQMVQLSVAFTQARISYTSPPFPVQFANTNPFAPTFQVRSPLGPLVSPSAAQPSDNFFVQLAARLSPGTYTLDANPSTYTLARNSAIISSTNIPAYVIPRLPAQSISGVIAAHSNSGGPVLVNYNFKR